MRILTLALLLVLTACAPDGSSSAGTQAPPAEPKEAVLGEPVEPQTQPPDSETTDPAATVPAESAAPPHAVAVEPVDPQEPVLGEPVEPRPQPEDAEPTDPSKTVAGEPVEPQLRAPSAPTDPSSARRPSEDLLTENGVYYGCKTNADCEVKNVGNCCGYFPACVNKESPTFPDKVKAACAAQGMSSICGFPEISGCSCVEGRCAPLGGPGAGGDVR